MEAANILKAVTAMKATGGVKHVVPIWSAVILFASIGVAIGPEISKMDAWSEAVTPAWIGGNVRLVAGIVMAWTSQFIVKK